jgi:hypothetical protein
MPSSAKKTASKATKGDELSLRVDGPLIAPEEFRKAVNAFVDIILQVSEDISKGGKKPLWNMSVRKGSCIFIAKPVADPETEKLARNAIKCVRTGMAMLERGTSGVPHFNVLALQAAGRLASVRAKPSRQGINVIEIASSTGKPAEVTPKTAQHVSRTVGVQHQAYGSIEGKLQTISERGSFKFAVWDALTDRPVNCFVPEDKFKMAYDAFRKRVSVSGLLQYDREGRPVSIKVEGIRVFRELSELPPIEHFRGILKHA